MNTFFFVKVKIQNNNKTTSTLSYGPYTTPGAAAEIMMDCLQDILSADLGVNLNQIPSYQASMSEWLVYENKWNLIATKASEKN